MKAPLAGLFRGGFHMAGILDGKVALITGAGSGIGQATSRIFAREGAKLVLADVVEEGGNQTLKMVLDLGANAIFVKCDVSKWSDVDAAVAKAVATYGRLDCAFNNAGIEGEGGNTHECTEDNWARVISINLTGVWLCMKAEIAQMLKQGGSGAVVNTSSGAGLAGIRGMPRLRSREAWCGGADARGGAGVWQAGHPDQRCLSRADSHADDGPGA